MAQNYVIFSTFVARLNILWNKWVQNFGKIKKSITFVFRNSWQQAKYSKMFYNTIRNIRGLAILTGNI
jgi:hypothetical protein